VVVAALTLSVQVASGSSPTSFCRIQALNPRGAINAAGVHVSVVNVMGCRVAIEAVRLTFTRSVQGEAYRVAEPELGMNEPVRPRGSGSRVLTLKLPSPLLVKKGDTCGTEGGVSEFVSPLLPVGSRVTVTLISIQGISETSVVHTTPGTSDCFYGSP
jgi:hypothetical protein